MCERWDFRRGFSVDCQRHKIGSEDYMIFRGSKRKIAILSSSTATWDGQGLWRTGTCSWSIKSVRSLTPRDSGETQNGERRPRGARRCSHRRWRRMETVGIKKGDGGGLMQLESAVGCSKDRFVMGESSICAARSRGPPDGTGFDRWCCIAGESAGGGSHGALLRRLEVAALCSETAQGRAAVGAGHTASSGARLYRGVGNARLGVQGTGAEVGSPPAARPSWPWPAWPDGLRAGLRLGQRRAEGRWVGPTGSAQLDRIGFVFFLIYF
jgi:hypothetical protein